MAKSVPIVPLLDRHKKFADEYLRTGNATGSARLAGASHRSAHVTGAKWLKRRDVSEYLAVEAAKLSAPRAEVSEQGKDLDQRILAEMEALAFANIGDFITIDEDGKPQVDFSTATPDQLRAITSVKTKTSRRFDNKGQHIATDSEAMFSLADKYRGLELLGKHRGLFKADEQRIVVDVADRLLNARRRLALLDVTPERGGSEEGPGGGGGLRAHGGGGMGLIRCS